MPTDALWQRFQEYYLSYDDLGFSLDISRMRFPDDFFAKMQPKVQHAFAAMRELEAGGIANPDEKRMVGHYWLRNPQLAPNDRAAERHRGHEPTIKKFASDVHVGRISAPNGRPFEHILLIGIGGSALGPQFVADALGTTHDQMDIFFFDNTDPDGFDRVLEKIGNGLCDHTSQSSSQNPAARKKRATGCSKPRRAFKKAGHKFPQHVVAVTGVGSELDQVAEKAGWLARFPMCDWVGGRTSVIARWVCCRWRCKASILTTSSPAPRRWTRRRGSLNEKQNAAMLLALMWFYAGDGRGKKDMVILPYKDRLALFSNISSSS